MSAKFLAELRKESLVPDSLISRFWYNRMFLGSHLESLDVILLVPRNTGTTYGFCPGLWNCGAGLCGHRVPLLLLTSVARRAGAWKAAVAALCGHALETVADSSLLSHGTAAGTELREDPAMP